MSPLLALVALVVFGAAAIGSRRAPHVMAAIVVCGFAVQPTLVFFISSDFCSVEDVVVLAGMLALLFGACFGLPPERRGYDAWLVGAIVLLLGMYVVNAAGTHTAQWSNGTRLVIEAFGLLLPTYARFQSYPDLALGRGCAIGRRCAQRPARACAAGHRRAATRAPVRLSVRRRGTHYGGRPVPLVWHAGRPLQLRGPARSGVGVRNARPTPQRALDRDLAAVLAVGIAVSFVRTEIVLMAVYLVLVLVRGRRVPSATALLLATTIAALSRTHTPAPAGRLADVESRRFLGSFNGRRRAGASCSPIPPIVIVGCGVGEVGVGFGL